ncbi:MAG: metabolite traffic protein EboE [Pirellulaceae bacterium]
MTPSSHASPPRQLGYCTNVHAGAKLDATRQNLERYALEVKRRFRPEAPMGVGLWLANPAAEELLIDDRAAEWADWLDEQGLVPFTMNGFPYGDFHQQVVKHRVYHPTWFEADRRDYTLRLFEILDRLLPPDMEGSISTAPLCWGQPAPSEEQLRQAGRQLRVVAAQLAHLERETGRLLHLAIEPEPGCFLQRSTDLVHFFENYLFDGDSEYACRRHLRVCHDVCHAAVMFEPQHEVIQRYRAAGIGIGKVQISSAVRLPLDEMAPPQRAEALEQLSGFAEDRYLHQTMVKQDDQPPRFYEDLPLALKAEQESATLSGEWRVHFHVPIYLERFGLLETSQADILACLEALRDQPEVAHFEVETYAWGVLPPSLQVPDLATGIAREMTWFADQLNS